MTEYERLKILRIKLGYKRQGEFAKALCIEYVSYSNIEQGRVAISTKIIKILFSKFNVNLIWLLDGEGEMFLNNNTASGLKVLPIQVDKQNNENITIVPQPAAAGYLAGYKDQDYINELPSFSIPFLKHGTFRGFQAEGDSMYPEIKDGNYIIGQYVEDFKYIKLNHVYILVCKDGIVVKRIIGIDLKKGELTLSSDNNYYPSYTITLDQLIELWYFKLVISSQIPAPNNLDNRVKQLEITVKKIMKK